VNYAFNIIQLVIVGLFMWLVVNPDSAWWIVAAVLGVTFATIPFTARMSRVIWMYMFAGIKYDPLAARRA
jgi:ABC-type iron transport system FetAB permease component